jgi:serine O-acetyltransferase
LKGDFLENTLKNLIYLIRSDLWRYYGKVSFIIFTKELLIGIGFRYSFWMRVNAYLRTKSFFWLPLKIFAKLIFRHYMFKFGMNIPSATEIDSGFYIGHFGGIVINGEAKIGKNCNINQGVTVGQSYRGQRKGNPTIGDNVFIGAGAKVFGNIKIGNNAAIGANSVVTKDVPDNSVVVGIPAKVISNDGSAGYIVNTNYL